MKKDGRLVELVGDQNPGPKALAMGKRGESKEDVRGGEMRRVGKSWLLKERRSEEMAQLNTSSSQGSEVLFESQRG